MPEDQSPPREAGGDVRPSSKHKWRGKLFSNEGRFGRNVEDLESTDSDIANFLQTAATKSRARPQPAELTPRIDTNAARRSPSPAPVPTSSSTVDFYRGPKPRHNKGLRVTFATAAPNIIGEGGEEAELPSKEVAKSLSYAIPRRRPLPEILNPGTKDELAKDDPRPSQVSDDDTSFQPASLQRRPTGLSDIINDDSLDGHGQEPDTSFFSSSTSLSPDLKPLPLPPNVFQEQRQYLPEASLQQFHPDISPLTDKIFDFDGGRPGQSSGITGNSVPKSLPVPSPETLAGNSVTPSPSPQPVAAYRGLQAASYNFPPTPSNNHNEPGIDQEPSVHEEPSIYANSSINLEPRIHLEPNIHGTPKLQDLKYTARTQATQEPQTASQSKPLSLRQIAKGLGDESLDEFDSRVRRFNDVFRLGVSAHAEIIQVPFAQWIRTACWWFLKGRQGLESEVRNKSTTPVPVHPSPILKQAYVNLAKAWWIVKDITPNHPEITRFGKASITSLCAMIKSFGNQVLAEQAEVHVDLVANLRALTMSMKRNEKLPPADLEIQRLDLLVLLELPEVSPEIGRLLINNISEPRSIGSLCIANPFFPIPLGDNIRHFNFGRMFVEFRLIDADGQEMRLPCVISVLRDRSEWGVRAVVASQDSQINLVISDDMANALPWRQVHWKIQSHEMAITLSHKLEVQLKLSEKDFKTLWGICDYTATVRKGFSPRQNEVLIFERVLQSFQCDDAAHFPSSSVSDCRLRIFEKKTAVLDPNTQRRTHNGFRLTVITPPAIKTLSTVNYDLGKENPLLFGIHRGKEGSRLVLRTLPSSTRLSPSFVEANDLDVFRHLLSGTTTSKEDTRFPLLQLRGLTISETLRDEESMTLRENPSRVTLPWTKLRVINKGRLPYSQETLPTTGSEHLRILADSDLGTLTDRINLAPGELQVGLSVDNFNEMSLLRPPQSDMTWSLADERITKEELNSVCMTLKIMLTFTTIRTYYFGLLEDLHGFHAMVTGFSILFDGLASNFAISRRRTGLPVYKKWDTNSARLQVVRQDKTVQLVGYFKNFSHGSCMNFVLKVTDAFEAFNKAGSFFVRIVDAKFAMPKGPDDQSRDFVCLDTPEYPSEHDDITIGFDNEHDRDRFASALPAQINKISKMGSLRR